MTRFAAMAFAACLSFAPLAAQALTVFSFADGGGSGTGVQSVVGKSFELEMTGNDNSISGIYTTFTIRAPKDGSFDVSWVYESRDRDGPRWDRAGYQVNGSLFQLSRNGGATRQTGSLVVDLEEDDLLSFYVYSVDGLYGPADFDVDGIFMPTSVPTPGSGVLLGSVVAVLGLRRRLRGWAQTFPWRAAQHSAKA